MNALQVECPECKNRIFAVEVVSRGTFNAVILRCVSCKGWMQFETTIHPGSRWDTELKGVKQ